MIAPCAVCGELVMSHPVDVVGEGRPAAELASLAHDARLHLAMRHPELVSAFNVVLAPAADYLALNSLNCEDAEFLTARDSLLEAAIETIRSAELVQQPEPIEPG